jgi:NAD(P)-dependent dehydrogenase (short-subunit alcohol dehydrogenase family)
VTRLAGKTAVITGGASGIGRATAQRFRDEGAAVIVADVRGEQDEFVPCDVTLAGDVERLAQLACEQFGHTDIVFANAGIATHGVGATMSESDWQRVFDVDVKGVWLVCRAFLPAMLERRAGSIVINASQLGLVGYPGLTAYGAGESGRDQPRALPGRGARRSPPRLCFGPAMTPPTSQAPRWWPMGIHGCVNHDERKYRT